MKVKLTKKEYLALLVTIYRELNSIFDSLREFKTATLSKDREKAILNELYFLITNDLGHDLESSELCDLL